jgi:hypothetical protein
VTALEEAFPIAIRGGPSCRRPPTASRIELIVEMAMDDFLYSLGARTL